MENREIGLKSFNYEKILTDAAKVVEMVLSATKSVKETFMRIKPQAATFGKIWNVIYTT